MIASMPLAYENAETMTRYHLIDGAMLAFHRGRDLKARMERIVALKPLERPLSFGGLLARGDSRFGAAAVTI